MTLPRGTTVIVADAQRMESYAAELLEDYAPHRRKSPLVRVLKMLRYPTQTALQDRLVAMCMPPAQAELETRMPYVCVWPEGAPVPSAADYASSVQAARAMYAQEAREHGRTDILHMLAAHEQGIYDRTSSV